MKRKDYVSLKTAKLLKKIGFDEPVAHCYAHTYWDGLKKYRFDAFEYLYPSDDSNIVMFNAYKEWHQFDINEINTNSSEFNYNQDFRKLFARINSGIKYQNDSKCYNMFMDSYTFYNSTVEEREKLRTTLPNYNDGDFEFGVFTDMISAPSLFEVQRWFREKYKIDIIIYRSFSTNNSYHYTVIIDNDYDNKIQQIIVSKRTYEKALNDAICYICKNLRNK